jgi:methanogenic corrinoid protein MtbC1
MKETVDAFVSSHIRDEVKIILGGSHLNADTCVYIGADSFTNDASVGVKTCLEWMFSKNRKEVHD